MVINVLGQKYQCGSNRGISKWDKPGILKELNSIMEWERCGFPFKLKDGGDPLVAADYEQDREFLGKEPELKPGNCFYWDGQLYAINDPDTIILMLSETGGRNGKRFLEIIDKEIELGKASDVDENLLIEEVESIPSDYIPEVPDYDILKILRDKYVRGRHEFGVCCLKLTYTSDYTFVPVEIYWKEWKVWYDEEMIDDKDELRAVLKSIWSYIYRTYPRLKIVEEEKKEVTEEEKIEEEIIQ